MNEPLWLKVLRAHCHEDDGLTIPFLVAAHGIERSETANVDDVIFILNSMQNDKTNGFYISFCQRLGAPVVTLLPKGYGIGLRFGLDDTWGTTNQDRLERILSESKDIVQRGCFSRTQGSEGYLWTALDAEEQSLIESLKHN